MNGEELKVIDQVAELYTELQRAYREWAKQFGSFETVIAWLGKKNLAHPVQEQHQFNLHSSYWNSITIPTLYIQVSKCMDKMKGSLNTLFQNCTEAQIDQIWYLLFFIHPIRHELYYYNLHYPEGYAARLARLIRSHRLGLKAAKTYLSRIEGRTIDDSFIKACGTTMFKHIHLHPTTCTSEKTDLVDIKEKILKLEIGTGNLSSEEIKIATALSTKATKSFERWIRYAPCAINEGPIFKLKNNKEHSDCWMEIVELLWGHDLTQEMVRAKLKEYYSITELIKPRKNNFGSFLESTYAFLTLDHFRLLSPFIHRFFL